MLKKFKAPIRTNLLIFCLFRKCENNFGTLYNFYTRIPFFWPKEEEFEQKQPLTVCENRSKSEQKTVCSPLLHFLSCFCCEALKISVSFLFNKKKKSGLYPLFFFINHFFLTILNALLPQEKSEPTFNVPISGVRRSHRFTVRLVYRRGNNISSAEVKNSKLCFFINALLVINHRYQPLLLFAVRERY